MPTTNTATLNSTRKLGDTLAGLMPKKAASANPSTRSLKERLARQQEIAKELPSLKQQLSSAIGRVMSAGVELRRARDKVSGLEATVERERSQGGESRSSFSLKDAKEDLQSIIQRIDSDELLKLEIQSEINTLQSEMDELIGQGAVLEEVREHLSALKDAEIEVARFEELIRDTEEKAGADYSDDGALDTLQQAREDLLADIAAGDAKPKELETLDAEIREILEDSDGSQASALGQERDNGQTLAGLKRRLSAVMARRDELTAQTPEVIEQLLIARAIAVSEEYLKYAQGLQLCYRQLQGISELLTSAVPGTQVRLLSNQWPNLLIPSLPLRTFDKVAHCDVGNGILFAGRQVRGDDESEVAQARTDELRQLDTLGVSRLFEYS